MANNPNDIYDLWKNKDGRITNQLGEVDNQSSRIINVAQGLNDNDVVTKSQLKDAGQWISSTTTKTTIITPKEGVDSVDISTRPCIVRDPIDDLDAVNYRTLKKYPSSTLWEKTPDSRTLLKDPTDIDMQGGKLINLADGVNAKDSVNIQTLIQQVQNILSQTYRTSFFSDVEGSPIKNIKNIASATGVGFVYNETSQTLILQNQKGFTQPSEAFLKDNTSGLYNLELSRALNLTIVNYKFLLLFEAHSINKDDFIHIWPNTTIQTYIANGQKIEDKGGSFIILNVNGVYRIGKESATNKTKRILQIHFWYYQNYQIMLVLSDGTTEWVPNLLKSNQLNITQAKLVYEEI